MGEGPSAKQVEFLKKAASGVLFEFAISLINELTKYCDYSQYSEIMRRMVTEELLSWPTLTEQLTKKKGFEAVIGAFQVNLSASFGPDNFEGEIREKGAVPTVYNCPFSNAGTLMCYHLCHLTGDVYCKLTDPELECLFTHHPTVGDPFCRAVIKKKSVPYKDLESLGNVVYKLPKLDLSEEQCLQYKNVLFTASWIIDTTIFTLFQGPEMTVEVLGPDAKRIGRNFGSSLIEANMLPVRDISVMGGLIHQFEEGFTMKGRITSMAPGVFAKEITDCPFKTAPPEICKQWEAFFNGILERINPELEYHYDRMMTMGDKTCKWSITKRQ